ncbi:hypothetical protein FRC12_003169 [Ceratobasidium sp. 428]|nr:hypothetical protein FRC12_003169 [Ceratobasidium sp. 428]
MLWNRQISLGTNSNFLDPLLSRKLTFGDSANRLEVQSWAYDELEPPEVVGIDAFTGAFALGNIELNIGHYWLTFAMKPVEPEPFKG